MPSKLVPARFVNGKLEPIKTPSKAKSKIPRKVFIMGSFGNSESLADINTMLRIKEKPRIEQWIETVLNFPSEGS